MKKENDNKQKTSTVGIRLNYFLLIVLIIGILIVSIYSFLRILLLPANEIAGFFTSSEPYLLIAILVTMIVVLIINFTAIVHEKSFDYDTEFQKNYNKILGNKLTDNGDGQSPVTEEFFNRLVKNLTDIKEYYTLSQNQAKAAFVLAVGVCICSFLIIAFTVIYAMINKDNDSSVTIISGVGTAVTAFISGTAFFVYNNSIKQLNYYYTALHEDERFLSSINLISWFSTPEKKDAMLQEIIESELKLNTACLSDTPHQASKRSETIKKQSKEQED